MSRRFLLNRCARGTAGLGGIAAGRRPPGGLAARPRLPAAFTLAEILVVIFILAIAAALVVPQMTGTSSMAAQSAARMVMADLEYAQNQAIFTQSEITVAFSLSGNSYTVSNASGPLIHPITKKAYVTDFGTSVGLQGVSIESVSFSGASVTFDALGAPDNNGSVTVSAGTQAYRVVVAPVIGRVTVEEAP